MQRQMMLCVLFVLFAVRCSASYSTNNKKYKSQPKPEDSVTKKSHPSSPPQGNAFHKGNSHTFNVLSFGAKGDGVTDDTKAFEAAWQAACIVKSPVIQVPSGYQFLVGPLSFSGPCQPKIGVKIDGTILAPVKADAWGSGLFQWILFSKLVNITVQGSGVIDGRGSVWWGGVAGCELSRKNAQQMPSLKPTALRFYGSVGVNVKGIKIQNSPQCHLKFDNCYSVKVSHVSISSPGISPNTDGVHLQNTQQAEIHHSSIACGDDCVSIQTGCSNIQVHNINCGPGHGVSIGGLGKDETRACVSNISVYNSVIQNAMNGVRIKTWQGGQGVVKGVSFANIQVVNVSVPIVIDQFYCDKRVCHNQTSAVGIAGVTYKGIKGTYGMKAVHFACSDSIPCTDILLSSIKLKPVQPKLEKPLLCWKTFGHALKPSIPPIPCIDSGKPNYDRVQTQSEYC